MFCDYCGQNIAVSLFAFVLVFWCVTVTFEIAKKKKKKSYKGGGSMQNQVPKTEKIRQNLVLIRLCNGNSLLN